MNKDK